MIKVLLKGKGQQCLRIAGWLIFGCYAVILLYIHYQQFVPGGDFFGWSHTFATG